METTLTLREAVRALRNAERLLSQSQSEEHPQFTIENRKEDIRHYERLVEQLRERTTTYVVCDVSGESDMDLPLDAIEMLVQIGILYECEECEARDDLDRVYKGDHREFHFADGHNDFCAFKALHLYDAKRWPEMLSPTVEYEICKVCGTQVIRVDVQ